MSDVKKGRQAIQAMLDMIGEPDTTDHTLAKVFCDAELEIRAALSALAPQGGDVEKATQLRDWRAAVSATSGWNEAIEAAAASRCGLCARKQPSHEEACLAKDILALRRPDGKAGE